jgi:hypothetical protein
MRPLLLSVASYVLPVRHHRTERVLVDRLSVTAGSYGMFVSVRRLLDRRVVCVEPRKKKERNLAETENPNRTRLRAKLKMPTNFRTCQNPNRTPCFRACQIENDANQPSILSLFRSQIIQ